MAASEEKRNFWKTLQPTISKEDYESLQWLAELYPPKTTTSNIPIKYPQDFTNLVHVTSFLSDNASTSQRLFHIRSGRLELPKCINDCGNTVKWHPSRIDYAKKCRVSCKKKDKRDPRTRLEKYEDTMIQRYNVTNYFASDVFKERNIKRNLEKYGVEHYVQSDEFKEKTRETMIDRYGVEHHMKLNEYNENSPFSREEVKEKIQQTFQEKYGGHPTLRRFSDTTIKRLNNREWLIHKHHDEKLTLSEISVLLEGYDLTFLSNKFDEHNIEKLNFGTSQAEKEISEMLKNNGIEVQNNVRTVIPPYELDIVIPEKKLAIEYCGLFWHSERAGKTMRYHYDKYSRCLGKGYRLLTIFEDEWVEKRQLIETKILHIIGHNKKDRVYARKCSIRHVTSEEKKRFFDTYHIQGDGPSSINIGLFFNDTPVAIMGFIRNKKYFNLNRYATSVNVVGGFSKLLKYFEREFNQPKIVTFADLRWSEGELYENNNFILTKTLPPDYFYCKGQKRYHKFNFRHSRLKNKIPNYDPRLSERENMERTDYNKIWDCGKKRYEKN